MDMATMCIYPPYQHALPHWKCVLRYCANYLHIDNTGQESDRHHYSTSPSINLNIYNLIARCTVYGRLPIDEHIFLFLFLQDPAIVSHAKYTPERARYDGGIYC